jgi:hypothetical protein
LQYKDTHSEENDYENDQDEKHLIKHQKDISDKLNEEPLSAKEIQASIIDESQNHQKDVSAATLIDDSLVHELVTAADLPYVETETPATTSNNGYPDSDIESTIPIPIDEALHDGLDIHSASPVDEYLNHAVDINHASPVEESLLPEITVHPSSPVDDNLHPDYNNLHTSPLAESFNHDHELHSASSVHNSIHSEGTIHPASPIEELVRQELEPRTEPFYPELDSQRDSPIEESLNQHEPELDTASPSNQFFHPEINIRPASESLNYEMESHTASTVDGPLLAIMDSSKLPETLNHESETTVDESVDRIIHPASSTDKNLAQKLDVAPEALITEDNESSVEYIRPVMKSQNGLAPPPLTGFENEYSEDGYDEYKEVDDDSSDDGSFQALKNSDINSALGTVKKNGYEIDDESLYEAGTHASNTSDKQILESIAQSLTDNQEKKSSPPRPGSIEKTPSKSGVSPVPGTNFYLIEDDESLSDWAPPAPRSHIVSKRFYGERPDEMDLLPGDIIGIEKVYDDGWAKAQNISQAGKRCILPLMVLTHIVTGPSQNIRKGSPALKAFEEHGSPESNMSTAGQRASMNSEVESETSMSTPPNIPERISSLLRLVSRKSKESHLSLSSVNDETS